MVELIEIDERVTVGEIGKVFTLDTEDATISTATVVKICYKKPDGTIGYWVASVVPATTKIEYSTIANDLSVHGDWYLQAYAEWGSTAKLYGDVSHVYVYDPLEYKR